MRREEAGENWRRGGCGKQLVDERNRKNEVIHECRGEGKGGGRSQEKQNGHVERERHNEG